MSNLFLHCGANRVRTSDVRNADTPAATDTHYPIPHTELIEVALNSARNDFGLNIVSQAHSMTQGGLRYFGMFELESDADYAPVIGLRNSHDKAFSAGLVIGSSVFVCDNLAFSGEVRIARKHTRYILRDLPVMVGRAFEKLDKLQRRMDLRIDAYKSVDFTDEQRDHVLMNAARLGALSWSGLGKVQNELANPQHTPEEFGVRYESAWNTFNACTEVLKTRSSNGVDPRWTQFLHRVFDQAVDLGDDEDELAGVIDGEFEVAA